MNFSQLLSRDCQRTKQVNPARRLRMLQISFCTTEAVTVSKHADAWRRYNSSIGLETGLSHHPISKKTIQKFADTIIGYEKEFSSASVNKKLSFAFVTSAGVCTSSLGCNSSSKIRYDSDGARRKEPIQLSGNMVQRAQGQPPASVFDDGVSCGNQGFACAESTIEPHTGGLVRRRRSPCAYASSCAGRTCQRKSRDRRPA